MSTNCSGPRLTELIFNFADDFSGTGVSPSQLPDIVGAFDPDNTEEFLKVVREHQKKFVALLQGNGIKIRGFRDFEELENFIGAL